MDINRISNLLNKISILLNYLPFFIKNIKLFGDPGKNNNLRGIITN